jgi:hypothetical protein
MFECISPGLFGASDSGLQLTTLEIIGVCCLAIGVLVGLFGITYYCCCRGGGKQRQRKNRHSRAVSELTQSLIRNDVGNDQGDEGQRAKGFCILKGPLF